MKRYVRLLITVCALLALVGVAIVVYRRADRKFHDRMAESYEFKRTHVSSGTVLSITPVQVGKEPERDVDNFPHFKICFSIDSFKDVPRDLQEQYQTAEKLRTAREGPRCMVPREVLRHRDLKPGDAIEVDYLLYGSGIITISRIVVRGQDLTSKRAGGPSELFKHYKTPTEPGAKPLAQSDPVKVGIWLRRAPAHV